MYNHLYSSFEDVLSAFVQANEAETDALFTQSDVTAMAVLTFTPERNKLKGTPLFESIKNLPMMRVEQVLGELGKTASRSRSAMFQRLKVGQLFPQDKRNTSLSWYHHVEAASTWTPQTPDAPYEWLEKAADEGWSVRTLRHEIANQGESTTPLKSIYWLNAEVCTVVSVEAGRVLLEIKDFTPATFDGGEIYVLNPGVQARVTLVTGVEVGTPEGAGVG